MMETTRTVRVLPLGPLSDRAVEQTLSIPLPITPTALRARINAAYPAFVTERFRIAVDHRFVDETTNEEITDATEVALLPPFAGG